MINEKLKSYAECMMIASDKIVSENPDFLVVPMMGSVPFIDVMSIVNNDFDSSKAIYMPASSRILNVNKIITQWYYNFLEDNINLSDPFPKILGIDEVVSGQSVVRCMNNIDIATQRQRKKIRQTLMEKTNSTDSTQVYEGLRQIDDITNEVYFDIINRMKKRYSDGFYLNNRKGAKDDNYFLKEILRSDLSNKLVYRSIGIEDSKQSGKRAESYKKLKKDRRIIPVSIREITTMDKPNMCSPQYETLKLEDRVKNKYIAFSPKISYFKTTPEYLNFLQDIARYVGKNPSDAVPINMNLIMDSSKYL